MTATTLVDELRELDVDALNWETCDWGECDRDSIAWARCRHGCAEPDHRVGGGWLPVCRAGAIVAAETGHDVILLGDVLELRHSPDAREAIADELELRADLALARA